jgi:hypothetical protein
MGFHFNLEITHKIQLEIMVFVVEIVERFTETVGKFHKSLLYS